MPPNRASLAPPVVVLLALLAACASSSGGPGGTGGAGGAGDGHVHPAGNGTPESETAACSALTNAASTKGLALGCVSTTPTCPDFLRAEFTTACLEYDEGSVQGCIAYYGMATTCDGLATSVQDCAVTPIAGSAGKGCP